MREDGDRAVEGGAVTRVAAGATVDPTRWRARARWMVHLGLLATAVASLVTLEFLHIRIAIHTVVGLAFIGFVLVHLFQRRRTLARWVGQSVRVRRPAGHRNARLGSDAVLAVIALNVLASGVVDWNRGHPVAIHLPVPFTPFGRWHALSSVALVVYLIVHVFHRRSRLRRSTIQ